jgi:hypothetical protein
MDWYEIKYGEWPEHGEKVLIQVDNLYFHAYFDASECTFNWVENENKVWGGPKSPIRWSKLIVSEKPKVVEPVFARAWHSFASVTVRVFSLF